MNYDLGNPYKKNLNEYGKFEGTFKTNIASRNREIRKYCIDKLGRNNDLKLPSSVMTFENGFKKYLFREGSKLFQMFPRLKRAFTKKKIDEKELRGKVSCGSLDYLRFRENKNMKENKALNYLERKVMTSKNFSLNTFKSFKLGSPKSKKDESKTIINSTNKPTPLKGDYNTLISLNKRLKKQSHPSFYLEGNNNTHKSRNIFANLSPLKIECITQRESKKKILSNPSISNLSSTLKTEVCKKSSRTSMNKTSPSRFDLTTPKNERYKTLYGGFKSFSPNPNHTTNSLYLQTTKDKLINTMKDNESHVVIENSNLNTILNQAFEGSLQKLNGNTINKENEEFYRLAVTLDAEKNFDRNFDKAKYHQREKQDRDFALCNLMGYYMKTTDELSLKIAKPIIELYNKKIHNKKLKNTDDFLEEILLPNNPKQIEPEEEKKMKLRRKVSNNNFKIVQLGTFIDISKKELNQKVKKYNIKKKKEL